MATNILVDVVTYSPQALGGTLSADLLADLLQNFDGAVESNPCHYLRMCKVLRRPANFPDALVGMVPNPGQVTQNSAADRDRTVDRRQTVAVRKIQSVEDLTVDIELRLLDGRVPNPHRARSLVSRQPRHLPFGQPALAPEPIHDLQLVRAARDCPQQPIPPCAGLVIKAAVHEGQQREGGVAQPTVPIIPVAASPDLFRKRGRRRRDNAAGSGIGQTFQGNQRTFYRIGPRARGTAP